MLENQIPCFGFILQIKPGSANNISFGSAFCRGFVVRTGGESTDHRAKRPRI